MLNLLFHVSYQNISIFVFFKNNFVQLTALAVRHLLRKEKEKGEPTSMAQVYKKF